MRGRHVGVARGYRRFGALRAWIVGMLALALAMFPGSPTVLRADPAPAPSRPAALDTKDSPQDYVIGPLDKLDIRVFQVKDLSFDNLQVDAGGQIVMPLIGSVVAEGKTAEQLSQELAQRLGERFLQSPQVTVTVVDSASQKITVEGDVKSPGVFQMRGRTTLMQAIAMGGGMSDTANLHKVAIIRDVGGVRHAAICDYTAIRKGSAPDPVIQGNDVVVVDGSAFKSGWSEMMKTLPLFSLLAIVA